MNSVSSYAALVFYLPLCTLTDTEEKPREARDWNIYIFEKKQYLMNTLYYIWGRNLEIKKSKIFKLAYFS